MFVLPFYSRISSWFGRRNAPTKGASTFHKGMDFAAPAGTPVLAAADGVITVKESQRGYGNVVYIRHSNGTETRYGHMSGFTDIQPGMEIHAGDQIGFVGSTGVSTGPHLHFEVRNAAGQAVDPQFILSGEMPQNINLMAMSQNVNTLSISPRQETLVKYQYPLKDWETLEQKLKEEQKKADFIAFSYQAGKTSATDELKSTLNSNGLGIINSLVDMIAGKGSLLGQLLNASNESETPKTVKFTLSKKDMLQKGFTPDEIAQIEQIGNYKRLQNAGQYISDDDLRALGVNEEKIGLLNTLAEQKQSGRLS